MRRERGRQPLPSVEIKHLWILFHAREYFVFEKHGVSHVFLSKTVPFVVIEAQLEEQFGFNHLGQLLLQHSLARTSGWDVGTGDPEKDRRWHLASLACGLEAAERLIEGVVENLSDREGIAHVLPERVDDFRRAQALLPRRLQVARPHRHVDAEHDDQEVDRGAQPIVRPDV